ncbi:hypothetical protein N0V88_006139 [Collariella sp. IMI 366227]|nr:hypothetical protein N0V88_006139 [Collariella sp. IMI 366227]
MFGNISFMLPVGAPIAPPKDVPPPTPVNLPRCHPRPSEKVGSSEPPKHLTSVLQDVVRPTDISEEVLSALGVHLTTDATLAQLIPDPEFLPDFEAWHALDAEEIHSANEGTRKPLNTGNLSPGCQTYLERRRELSIPNLSAYRTIRRAPPPKGQAQARLGNAYEFYRHLELVSAFWVDTSNPPAPEVKPEDAKDASVENGTGEAEGEKKTDDPADTFKVYRTGSGQQMPVEYRQNMVTAFLKLVAYDFTCNVTLARTEPRLQIVSKTPRGSPRNSHIASHCNFIFRSPQTREAARAGIVEGPVAAVSTRHILFPPADGDFSGKSKDWEAALDLSRELIAALLTAQHRAREGRTEKRIGEGQWWCSKPRWGGGSGGPIGREIDMLSGGDDAIGDKDAPPPETAAPAAVVSPASTPTPTSAPIASSRLAAMNLPQRLSSRSSSSSSNGSSKGVKRLKKSGNHPMYDNYRMIRPPMANWDKKTRYEAIGRARGADYDDIFVVSALFHHVSILRVRVPDRLLAVLGARRRCLGRGKQELGRLEVWRSRWFDFFVVEERVQAMQVVWGMMGWMMREVAPKNEEEKGRKGM